MSALLDALLGPARLAECLAHDAALTHPKEQAMKHHATPLKRLYAEADMEAADDPDEPGFRELDITRFGMPSNVVRKWFPNSNAANLEAASLSCGGAVVMVRPVGEVCAA